MKKILIILIILFSVNYLQSAQLSSISENYQNNSTIIEQNYSDYTPFQFINSNNYWGAFWINFIIAAIGTYLIWGVAAGIVSVGITYFVVNGNKKAMKMAIWGAVLGTLLGAGIRLLVLFV